MIPHRNERTEQEHQNKSYLKKKNTHTNMDEDRNMKHAIFLIPAACSEERYYSGLTKWKKKLKNLIGSSW
jgi:hypothetical protein